MHLSYPILCGCMILYLVCEKSKRKLLAYREMFGPIFVVLILPQSTSLSFSYLLQLTGYQATETIYGTILMMRKLVREFEKFRALMWMMI